MEATVLDTSPRTLYLPDPCLVLLIGASGAGKSTFARKHFRPTEVISSDHCRGLVGDNETDQTVTPEAFALVHFIVAQRLKLYRLAVVDATSVRPEDRRPLLRLAKEHNLSTVAIVLDLPQHVSVERNKTRADRQFGDHVILNQRSALLDSLRNLREEGFREVYVLKSEAEINAVRLERTPLKPNRRGDSGPFDLIGDVHGCFEELQQLLTQLGYQIERSSHPHPRFHVTPPPGRRALFLGDLIDRGPGVVEVLQLVMDMVEDGAALCLAGNHEARLERKLEGRNVKLTHGLEQTVEQMEPTPPAFKRRVRSFIEGLSPHLWLDEGRLVAAHAGLIEPYFGRTSGKAKQFATYGDTTGELDEEGLPIRADWALEYRGKALVVYGHTPVKQVEWRNNTLCIDTGCVFGGQLTALRYPERELVSIPALREYYPSLRWG